MRKNSFGARSPWSAIEKEKKSVFAPRIVGAPGAQPFGPDRRMPTGLDDAASRKRQVAGQPVRRGQPVGQLIGTVSSLDGGEVLETVSAPADCVVVFFTSSPAVADDGLLIGLGAD